MEEENREANVTRSFKVSGMPMGQWLIWEKSAIEEYADCYWLKIISDHKKAKDYDIVVSHFLKQLQELQEKTDLLAEAISQKEKEGSRVPRTLGR